MPLADPTRIFFSLADSLRRHPKRVTASLAVLLLGTAVTAFGVAPLAPDAADLPVREVFEAVQALPTQSQVDMLSDFRFKLFRTESTRSSDTFDALLKRLNIDDSAAAVFLRQDPNARMVLAGRAGKNVTVEATDSQQLLKLSVRWPTDDEKLFKRLVVERTPSGLTSRLETAPYVATSRLASGSWTAQIGRAGIARRCRGSDAGCGLSQSLYADDSDNGVAPCRGARCNRAA